MCNRMPPHIPGYCPPTEPTACPFCDDPHCKGLSAHQVETIDDIAADRDRLVLQLAAAESRARAAEAVNADIYRWALQLIENDGSGAVYRAGREIEAHDQLRAILYYKKMPGATLLAELEAARELFDAIKEREGTTFPSDAYGAAQTRVLNARDRYIAARGAR